jgi:hypothetical protein
LSGNAIKLFSFFNSIAASVAFLLGWSSLLKLLFGWKYEVAISRQNNEKHSAENNKKWGKIERIKVSDQRFFMPLLQTNIIMGAKHNPLPYEIK